MKLTTLLRLDLLRTCRPRPADYRRVFLAPHADEAMLAYARLWREHVPPAPPADPGEISTAVATVDELLAHTRAAREFPGGYRSVAPFLAPGNLWVCCRWGGLLFDGLVPLDGRWAWFPKPWNYLLGEPSRALGHWSM